MNYFSMFSGIGGFELGIERAFSVRDRHTSERNGKPSSFKQSMEPTKTNFQPDGNKPDNIGARDSRKVSCVGYSEIDQHAIKTYEEHFKHENFGDATTIIPTQLPDFELLVGGFPCQSFSIAGKRGGFNDTRGTLFFDVARILKDKKPRHLVLENVKGLLSHDSGKTFQTILRVLADLGYGVEWQILNSKDFGVPQNRERVYIVGHLRGRCGRKIFPLTRFGMGTENPAVTLTARGYGSQRNGTYVDVHPKIKQLNKPKHSNDRLYSKEGISPSLNTMQGGGRQPFIEQTPRIRRLTPVECERLQGFPDNWTVGSDTQRYKQCGNAVTVNTVQYVMEALLPCLETSNDR